MADIKNSRFWMQIQGMFNYLRKKQEGPTKWATYSNLAWRLCWNMEWVEKTLAGSPPLSKPKILIVISNEYFREGTAKLLEGVGYHVTAVDTLEATGKLLFPESDSATEFVAVLIGDDVGSDDEEFPILARTETSWPFPNIQANADAWASVCASAEKEAIPLSHIPNAPAEFLARLKELSL